MRETHDPLRSLYHAQLGMMRDLRRALAEVTRTREHLAQEARRLADDAGTVAAKGRAATEEQDTHGSGTAGTAAGPTRQCW